MSKKLELLEKALHFAENKHAGQIRKDRSRTPYIVHPLRVTELLLTIGGITDETTLAAALLHDVLEDTNTSLSELKEKFGQRISSIVQELTDDKKLPKKVRKEIQIDVSRRLSKEASLIRIGDKIANVEDVLFRAPIDWNLSRREEYVGWAARVLTNVQFKSAELSSYFSRLHSICLYVYADYETNGKNYEEHAYCTILQQIGKFLSKQNLI